MYHRSRHVQRKRDKTGMRHRDPLNKYKLAITWGEEYITHSAFLLGYNVILQLEEYQVIGCVCVCVCVCWMMYGEWEGKWKENG